MPPATPLAVAERALLQDNRLLTKPEALDVARLPLDELPNLIALAHNVRLTWRGPEVELESLINAKSGACAEDCAFCSQSAHFSTDVDVYPFLDDDEMLKAARETKDAGATQFCIVVAVRSHRAHQCVAGVQQDILRRDIEMDDVTTVGEGQGVGDLPRDL